MGLGLVLGIPDVRTTYRLFIYPLTTHDSPPSRDFRKAEAYRDAEVPFLVYNVPEAEEVVNKWNTDGYLEKLLGDERYRTEVSHNNHFMYFSGGSKGHGKAAWRAPTSIEKMSFKKFKDAAVRCDMKNCSEDEKHFYFRVTAPSSGHFMFKVG